MATHYSVVQFTTKGRFTGKVFGPFTEVNARQFKQSASVAGYYYAVITVTNNEPYSKEAVIDAVNAYVAGR